MLASTCVLFAGCAEKLTKDNPGAIIPLYMTHATSFDPATAYNDDASAKLLSLVYQGLFSVSSSGKLTKALAKSYSYDKEDRVLTIKLKSTMWSDGTYVDAEDFVYAWTRILDPEFTSEAASLLFGIKNAIEVKNGDVTQSHFGVIAAEKDKLEIELEEWADYETVLYNLASVALSPVREDVAKKIKDDNWATLPAILVSNGCFYVKRVELDEENPMIVLERNTYYYLNPEKNESLDKFVVPYRLNIYVTNGTDSFESFVQRIFNSMKLENPSIVNEKRAELSATLPEEELAQLTNAQLLALAEQTIKDEIKETHALDYIEEIKTRLNTGTLGYYEKYDDEEDTVLYSDTIPLSSLNSGAKVVTKDMLMTGAFCFNTENPVFASNKVRVALSSVLDREYIAKTLVGSATAATGLISPGVFNTGRKTSFRNVGGDLITESDVNAAKAVVDAANLESKSFTISVSPDTREIAVAEYAKAQWEKLGFSVSIKILGYETYDYTEPVRKKQDDGSYIWVDEVLYDGLTRDNTRNAYFSGNYDVIFYDINMMSVNAFAALSVFSPKYSGGAYELDVDFTEGEIVFDYIKHSTGYSNSEYDALIDAALVEKNKSKKAELLHKAEELLMQDMPVAPLFYYQNSYVVADEIKGVKTNYFGITLFDDAKYSEYVATAETTAGTMPNNPSAPTTTAAGAEAAPETPAA